MTELEEKLIDLGYEYEAFTCRYIKQVSKDTTVYFMLKRNESIYAWGIECRGDNISTEEHIVNSEKATNMLWEDIKKLLNIAVILIDGKSIEEKVPNNDGCIEEAKPALEWYKEETERLTLENEKLKKLVDILLERAMYRI